MCTVRQDLDEELSFVSNVLKMRRMISWLCPSEHWGQKLLWLTHSPPHTFFVQVPDRRLYKAFFCLKLSTVCITVIPHSRPIRTDISYNVAAVTSSCQTKPYPGTNEHHPDQPDLDEKRPQLCPFAHFLSSVFHNPPPKQPLFFWTAQAEEEEVWEKRKGERLANFSPDDTAYSSTTPDLHLPHLSRCLSTLGRAAESAASTNSTCLLLLCTSQHDNIQCVVLFILIRIHTASLRHLHRQWGLSSWKNGLPGCSLFQHTDFICWQSLSGQQATEENKGNLLFWRPLHRKVRVIFKNMSDP